MPGIEIKGRSKIANYRHGGRTGKFGGGRTNLLEQLGRVEAEPSNPNRRAEISRVHGELNRGYAKGGRAGFVHGFSTVKKFAKQYHKKKKLAEDTKKGKFPETESLTHQVGPYVGDVGSEGKKRRAGPKARGRTWSKERPKWERPIDKWLSPKRKSKPPIGKFPPEKGKYQPAAEGGRIGFKKGTDKKWIQKAVDPKHKGYCTPMTKKTCTPARKALARTFKKKAKTGWG